MKRLHVLFKDWNSILLKLMKSNINVLLSFLTNFLKQRVCYEELKFSPDKTLITDTGSPVKTTKWPVITDHRPLFAALGGWGGHEKAIYREELPKKGRVTWIVGRFRGAGGGLDEKEGSGVFEGDWYSNAHYVCCETIHYEFQTSARVQLAIAG